MATRFPDRSNSPPRQAVPAPAAHPTQRATPNTHALVRLAPEALEAAAAVENRPTPPSRRGSHRRINLLQEKAARLTADRQAGGALFAVVEKNLKLHDETVHSVSTFEVDTLRLMLLDEIVSQADETNKNIRMQILPNNMLGPILERRACYRRSLLDHPKYGLASQITKYVERKMSEPSINLGTEKELDAMADFIRITGQFEKISSQYSKNTVDLRQSLEFMPNAAEELAPLISYNSTQAMCFNQKALFPLIHVGVSGELELLMGKKAAKPIEEQLQLLRSGIRAIKAVRELDFTGWTQQVRPAFEDLCSVALDCASAAIQVKLPGPDASRSANDIEEAQSILKRTILQCTECADLISEWLEVHPSVKSTERPSSFAGCAPAAPGGIVSVVSPSGMRIVARIQDDGSARSLDPDSLRYESSGHDSFHLAPESATDDANADTEAGTKPSIRASKALKKGLALLELDLARDAAMLDRRKGLSDPEQLHSAYGHLAQKWQTQAKAMKATADLLGRFQVSAYESAQEQKQALGLPQRLNDKAEELAAQSRSLTQESAFWSLIKAYGRPKATQWHTLLANQQIESVDKLKALPSDPPRTLFELKIQAKSDADQTSYPPVWMHLHTHEPMTVNQVLKAAFSSFSAVHLKSDAGKNHGKEWIAEQHASGRHDAEVHRSKVNADVLQAFLEHSGKSEAASVNRRAHRRRRG